MRVTWWKYTATAGAGVILSLLSFFAVQYIGKVEALELQVHHDSGILENIREDVRWLRDNMEPRK